MITQGTRAVLRTTGALLAWMGAVLAAPFLELATGRWLPTPIANFLFFWPQMAYPYNVFTAPPPNVGPRVWPGFWVAFWLLLGTMFVWRAKTLRLRNAVLLAGVLVIAGTIILQLGILAAGLYFELDGP